MDNSLVGIQWSKFLQTILAIYLHVYSYCNNNANYLYKINKLIWPSTSRETFVPSENRVWFVVFQKMNSLVLLDILWIVTCPFNGVVQSIGTYYRCYQNCDLLGVLISDFNHYQSMKKYRCFLYASMQDSKRRRVNLTTSSMVPNPRRYTIQVHILKLDRALSKGVDRGNFECFN